MGGLIYDCVALDDWAQVRLEGGAGQNQSTDQLTVFKLLHNEEPRAVRGSPMSSVGDCGKEELFFNRKKMHNHTY